MLFARAFAVVAVACLAIGSAAAQHRHDHKPKHGGLINETAGFVYELKVTSSEITVWVTDEDNKPVGTQGSSAKVTLIDSGSRVEVPLSPAGDNRHGAQGSFKVKSGMAALLEVAVGGKPVAKLRYTLK